MRSLAPYTQSPRLGRDWDDKPAKLHTDIFHLLMRREPGPPAGSSQLPRNPGQVRASSRYKDPHGRRKGRDADEADVVYIRAQLRPYKGKIQA